MKWRMNSKNEGFEKFKRVKIKLGGEEGSSGSQSGRSSCIDWIPESNIEQNAVFP